MSRYIYRLTEDELSMCASLAHRRNRIKEDYRVRSKIRTAHYVDPALHEMSIKAQVGVAHFLGLDIDTSVSIGGNKSGFDFRFPWGHTVDVMYRKQRGWDLMLDSMDVTEFVADATILVWPERDGATDAVEMAGYCSRRVFNLFWKRIELPKKGGGFYEPKAGITYHWLGYFGNYLRYVDIMRKGRSTREYIPERWDDHPDYRAALDRRGAVPEDRV